MTDGLTPAEEWAETDVHKASSYSCSKCGAELDSPEDFYRHLDEVHRKEQEDDDG